MKSIEEDSPRPEKRFGPAVALSPRLPKQATSSTPQQSSTERDNLHERQRRCSLRDTRRVHTRRPWWHWQCRWWSWWWRVFFNCGRSSRSTRCTATGNIRTSHDARSISAAAEGKGMCIGKKLTYLFAPSVCIFMECFRQEASILWMLIDHPHSCFLFIL